MLHVPEREFSIEAPWDVPEEVERHALVRAVDGSVPRLATSFAAYRDAAALVVVFSGEDDETVAHYLGHDEPLWQEDVVEVFLAPATSSEYFELEVNPLGTTFDARIVSPNGDRATMTTDLSWDCNELFAAVRKVFPIDGTFRLTIVLRIPFASLTIDPPRPGDEWGANFFRIDRSAKRGDEFMAWQPTRKSPPDFHVPAAFGRLVF
ncbi:MAG TPA: carbohydrate-binding family 9-like protein [Vicinamibacterales bacterium]|nr:carbohydrate-binding family 9-like protein [Vicinamibacterales bacterium]